MSNFILQNIYNKNRLKAALLIINCSLLMINCSAQCFQGKVAADANAVCSGHGVTLSCMLIEDQIGSIEDSLKLVSWQYSTTPDNPGSWTMMNGSEKTLSIASLSNTISYRAQVKYAGCSPHYTAYITVTVYTPTVGGTLQGSANVCEANNSGALSVSGQTGAVKQWYKRDTTDLDWVALNNGNTFCTYQNLLLTTRYKVELQNGVCPSVFTTDASVEVHPNPVALFTASNTCDGDITKFTNQSAVSAGYIKSHSWQFGDGAQSAQVNPTKQYYNVDTYQVTLSVVSDQNCTSTTTIPVVVHPNPISNFTATDNCIGFANQFTNTSKVRSGESINYFWNFGDGVETASPVREHQYDASGAYRVKLVATTVNGQCRDSVEKDVIVFALPLANAGNDTTICAGHCTRLIASGGSTYAWTPYDGLSSNIIQNPMASPRQNTLYTVMVTDANGCVNTAQANVFIKNDFTLHPYNIITPDGNGENDVFIIDFIDHYPDALVRIVNRWGEEVFASKNYDNNNNAWKGTNKKGDILPESTYYYIISIGGDGKIYKGAVALIRNNK